MILHTPLKPEARSELDRFIIPLAKKAYLLTGLRKAEMLEIKIATVIDQLNTRFAKRLGFEVSRIVTGHNAYAQELFSY